MEHKFPRSGRNRMGNCGWLYNLASTASTNPSLSTACTGCTATIMGNEDGGWS